MVSISVSLKSRNSAWLCPFVVMRLPSNRSCLCLHADATKQEASASIQCAEACMTERVGIHKKAGERRCCVVRQFKSIHFQGVHSEHVAVWLFRGRGAGCAH